MFSVLVIRLRSLRLLRVSGIVMRLRMFLLLITFLKASHSFRNRLLVICKNAYLFATMIMTSVSSPFSCCSGIVRLNLMCVNAANQVVSVGADIAFDADPKFFACLVRFESSSVPTTLPTAYDVYPLDGRHDGGYYTVKDCVTIDVLPRTPGNNVYVG